MHRKSISAVAVLALTALLLPAFAENPEDDPDQIGNRDVGKGVNFYSLEKEIALGKQMAQEVERQAKIVDDPIIAEYVNRIGQNLVRNSDAKVPFTIKVLDTEEVNAFALPGGFFFVNTGLILKADTEAELAGVMAHEIAHVAARHGTRQATRGEHRADRHHSADLHGRLDRLRHPAGRQPGDPHGLPAVLARHSRAEADYLGLQYMYKAGYDPTAFVDFFEKIEIAGEEEARAPWPRSSPRTRMTDDRIKAAQEEIQKDSGAQAGIRGEHVGIQRCEGAAGHAAQPPQIGSRTGPNRPKLRRAPGSGTVDSNDGGTNSDSDDDDRPTLKRRPDSGN